MILSLNTKKIAAFGVFFLLFILQTGFSINALYNLHVSHHVIEEEWEEYNRVQSLEDLLDEQSVQLLAVPAGKSFLSDQHSRKQLADISDILDQMIVDYQKHQQASPTMHERTEDAYLVNIIGPLKSYLDQYNLANATKDLTSTLAKQYVQRLTGIIHQIHLLRKADAAFAQKALDQAKKARKETLRNSLIISILLIFLLIVWGVYFLINLERQTKLVIYQQKIMTAGLLAQSLAHEIRNPLGVIKGAADLLARRESLDIESRELAGYMVDEVVRIDSLIKDLLALSRKKSTTKEDADISQIIRSVLDLTSGKIKQAGVTVHFTQKAEGILCYCSPGQIRQIVLNLVLNALDVSPKNAIIEIITEKKDNSYMISIRDYGKGFSPQDKDRIFDLFYTTKESGFGIGLAVVKRIVDEHQGEVLAQSWPGQGSLFTVILPLR